jgi:hypothetical protein
MKCRAIGLLVGGLVSGLFLLASSNGPLVAEEHGLSAASADHGFARPASRPWDHFDAPHGFAQVQVSELLTTAEQLEVQSATMMEQMVITTSDLVWRMIARPGQTELWNEVQIAPRDLTSCLMAIQIQLQSVEAKPDDDPDEPRGTLTLSANRFVIRSQKPIEWERLKAAVDSERAMRALKGFAPELAERMTEPTDGQAPPTIGQMLEEAVSQPEPNLLVITETDEDNASAETPVADPSAVRRLQAAWQAIDGGLASCAVVVEAPQLVEGDDARPVDRVLQRLTQATESLAVGVDLDTVNAEVLVRVALVPREPATIEELRAAITELWQEGEFEDVDAAWAPLVQALAADQFAERAVPGGGAIMYAAARCPLPKTRVAAATR